MNEKMKTPLWSHNKINIRPPDYSKENFLANFTPQTQLTLEQIFWSKDVLKMKTEALAEQAKAAKPIRALAVYPLNIHVKLVPRVLPTKSQVKINIFTLIQLFMEFEKTCKTRITPTGLTEGEMGFEQTKECYLIELEAEVDQNAVKRKCDEIERKNLLITNDTLIENCLSKDVFYIATNSEFNVSRFSEMHDAHTVVQARCLELETELSKLKDKIQKDDHDVMETRSEADRTLDFRALVFQITQLTEKVSVFQEQNELFRVENAKLNNIARNYSVTPKVLAHGMYAIDVEPILPRCRNNRKVNIEYLKLLKESVATIRDRSRLMNFVKRFIETVRFGNDHFGALMGYEDYVIGESVISRVYYVEGLGNNLFTVRQFYDSDLEVSFKKHSCYVRDTVGLNKTVKFIRPENGTKFVNQVLTAFYEKVGIFHQKSVPRTPQQKGVVERRNRTLVEAARTMLIFSKASMFLWAEVVATACHTQNRSLIHTRHNKTPYELVHDMKPDLIFF
uniref:Putative ribonuclease H-like domain-containing protein n=1 Tax=Tanacetum cinerariifolium TaxID=118510 RepID=A0A6L2MCL9_TANCI|nr:putative ribonuclease H-like domain-containing protein [Tanacetum cinerariifolium]